MALWTYPLSDAEISAFEDGNSGAPLCIPFNQLNTSGVEEGKWVHLLQTPYSAMPDKTLDGYPVRRIHDGFNHIGTMAQDLAKPYYTLVFEFPESTASPIDSIVIYPGNFADIANMVGTPYIDVRATISETDPTFAGAGGSDDSVIANWRTNSDLPLVELSLTNRSAVHGYNRWSNFKYLMIEFVTAVDLTSDFSYSNPAFLTQPVINEVFLGGSSLGYGGSGGKRAQLSSGAQLPHSRYGFSTDYETFQAVSGISNRYVNTSGRRVFSETFITAGDYSAGTTDRYGLNDADTLLNIWTETSFGTTPFIWCPVPYLTQLGGGEGNIITTDDGTVRRLASVNTFFVSMSPESFDLQLQGPHDRSVTLEFEETPRYLATLMKNAGIGGLHPKTDGNIVAGF